MIDDINLVNIKEKFSQLHEVWKPKIVGEVNNCYIKIAKFEGEYDWHFHEKEDELFWVISGEIVIELRSKKIILKEGEFVVIPHGVEHKPIAEKIADVVMIELKSTVNTGNIKTDRTIQPENLERM